jgi:hypothetical protein
LDNLKSSNGDVISKRPWTIKDDDQLRVLAATGETSGSIAVRLKRRAAAIRKRAILGHRAGRFDESAGLKAKKS